MTKFLYTLVFTLCVFCMNAQTLWIGAVSNDWNDAANWTAGIPTSGQTATLPVMESGNSPIYGGSPVIDFTIQNAGTLTFNTVVFNNGTIINFGGGIIINENYFINAGSMVFDNDGVFNNEGVFDNFGTYEHAASAELNNLGTFNSLGDLNSNGPISNQGTLTISGKFVTTQKLENSGTLTVTGFVDFPFGSELVNTTSGEIRIGANAKLQINSALVNSGLLVNNGSFAVQSASVLENTGIVRNNASLELSGKIMNQNNLVNNDGVMIKSGGQLENKNQVNNQGEITMEICAILIQDSGSNIGGSIQTDGLTYEISGSANETNLEFGETFTDIDQTPSPQPACKSDNFFFLDESGVVEFTAADIDRGRSYGSCGAQLVDISVSPTSFTAADAGVRIVEITVTDNFGRTASCQDFVTIIPFSEPITASNSAAIDSDCGENITASTLPGANFAEVSFPTPVASSSCSGMPLTTLDCSSIPAQIDGFVFLGEQNGSKYYCSNTNDLTWHEARDLAIDLGGHLATVNDAAENEFIRNNILADFAWIGYNDEAQEGDFRWVSGDSNYENWRSGEPNNGNGTEHFARILKSDGKWTDRNAAFRAEAVIEIPCPVVMENSCAVAPEVDGMMYLGTFDNAHYYKKPDGDLRYEAAKVFVESRGGNLPVISSEAENSFLRNAAGNGSYWLALTDENQEGSFEWTTGAPVSYTNWNQGEPNDFGEGEDYTQVRSDGRWNDVNATSLNWAIMEIPCQTNTGSTICSLDNYGSEGTNDRLVWLKPDGEDFQLFETVGENTFQEFSDGTALLSGKVQSQEDSNRRYNYSVKLQSKRTYAEWTSLGRLVKEADTPLGDPTNWSFYEVVEGESTFTGEGALSGQTLNVSNNPADFTYGFQIGFGANLKDGSFGISGWWAFSGSDIGRGDFNGDLNNCQILPGGDGEPTITQIQGIQSGDNFPVGTTQIAYRITDDCGNEEICLFDVIVEATPSELTLTNCPGDIVVDAPICEEGTTVSWELPSATTTCFIDDIIVDRVDQNPLSGEFFPIGTTTISYIVSDSCGNAEVCVFNVIVNEVEGELSVNCSEDITITAARNETAAIADFAAPTATTTGSGVTVRQLDGPESGASLEIGTYQIIFLISDDCNNTELCIFNITIEPTVIDDDNDGVPLEEDCDDNDASIPTIPGTTCDDNNEDTINDVIQADGCSCAGIINPCILDQIVTVSSSEELCEPTGEITFSYGDTNGRTQIAFSLDGGETYEPNVLDNIGSITYDGLTAGTYDLMVRWGDTDCPTELGAITIQGNGASPEADFTSTPVSCGASDGSITFSFEDAPNRTHLEFSLDGGNNWLAGVSDLTSSITYDGLAPGTYELYIRWGDNDCPYQLGEVTLLSNEIAPGTACDDGDINTENDVIGADGCSCGGDAIVDADEDGVRAEEDCDDNNASIPTTPGTTCDDGDATTENDVIGADGCSCGGDAIVDADGDGVRAEEDCDDNNASIPAAPGSVCNDNNDLTENDLIGTDGCSCAGTLIPTCTIAGGEIAFLDGSVAQTICADDGIANPLSVNVFGPIGTNQQWVITDADLNILGLPVAPPFDLEGVEAGTCLIWSLSFEDGITGLAVGGNAGALDGCYELSNPVSVVRLTGADCPNFVVDADGDGIAADEDCDDNDASVPTTPGTACDDANPATENDVILSDGCGCSGTIISTCDVDGGTIAFADESIEQTICAGDNIGDPLQVDASGFEGANQQWVITDLDLNILGLPAAPPFDLEGAGAGTCLIWNLSFENGLEGVEVGLNAGALDGCYDLSNPITVIRLIGADCPGFVVDADGDGIPADEDCDDNDPSVPATPGTTCDDANADTENDVVTTDGCGCEGTPVVTTGPDCADITITAGNGSFTVTGLDGAPVSSVQCFNSVWVEEYKCFGDCDASITETLVPGSYRVFVKYYTASYQLICSVEEVIEVTAGEPVDNDNDNDGVSAGEDCDDNDASVPTTPGTTCDDANADTENDVILANGCDCAGTNVNGPTDNDNDGVIASEDCDDNDPSVPATPGTTCDDANADTENDIVTADGCGCEGTPVVVTGPDCANISITAGNGSFTVSGLDGAPVTSVQCFNSQWQEEYKCFGDCDATITEALTPGSYQVYVKYYTADYQLICQVEEVIEVTAGEPIDNDNDGVPASEDCDDNDPSVPTTPGTACDDNNPNTDHDEIGADGCSCDGTSISGCDIVVTYDNLICDGQGTETINDDVFTVEITVTGGNSNDQWSGMLGGQTQYGIYGETVEFGPFMTNSGSNISGWFMDVLDSNCAFDIIVTAPVGCSSVDNDNDDDGVPASEYCDDNDASVPATPGTTCDDANADTENDVVTADGCGCEGTPVIVAGPDCADISVTAGNGTFTITGLDGAPVTSVQVFNALWQEEYKCFGDCDATITETVAPGSYQVYVKYYSAGYKLICSVEEVIEVTGVQLVDNDNDGVPADEDCDDNNARIPATPGTLCNDGNDDTVSDVILANGCDCEGTLVVDNDNDGVPASEDCDDNNSLVPTTQGTPCDDNNPATNNDVILANGCDCEGTLFVDNDNDGVIASEDCDDNNPAIPATPGTTCNDNNANTVNDVILADGCDCAGVEPAVEVCTTRTASNVINCVTDINYGGWLRITGEGYYYDISNSELVEYTDGTALFTGTWTNQDDPNIVFDFEINATGKTTTAPADSPKEHRCLTPDYDAFYYYANFDGILNGSGSMEGAQIAISTFGAALQLGQGANATGTEDTFGASAWYSGSVIQQPTSGNEITFNELAGGHIGDINIKLTGDVNDCDDISSYAIAPNASFLHLNGTKVGSTVGLSWTSNNDYRTALNILERSENGTDWMAIEETASLTRSSNATFYQTKDDQPAFGVNHYRVKQMMNDGTFIYSNVVDLRFDIDPTKIVVYPNPTVEEINISLVEYAGNQGTLRIANALGQKMYEVSYDEIPAAPVHIELDRSYEAGTYSITVIVENRKPVTKLFIVSKL